GLMMASINRIGSAPAASSRRRSTTRYHDLPDRFALGIAVAAACASVRRARSFATVSRAHHRVGIAAALALFACACAINPVTGRPEFVLVSTEQEIRLGREEAQRVEQEMGLVRDPALLAYVGEVGARLAQHSPQQKVEYSFHVADMVEPNAFALPGGYIYVSRGLLPLVNSEDELANVIGHEIGHVAARHAVQRLTRAAPIAILTGLPAAATGIVSPELAGLVSAVGGLAGAAILAPYSRGQENDADRIGQELAAKSGWDPDAMSTFMHTLDREEALRSEGERGFSFLRTHPSAPERVAKTRQRAADLARAPRAPVAATRAAFLARLAGIRVGANPAEGVFDGQRFLHPDFDLSVLYPPEWKTTNTRRFVGAQEPRGDALSVLEIQSAGDDPVAAAREFEAQTELELEDGPERISLGGRPAAQGSLRVRSSRGVAFLDLVWVAHAGQVFRFSGLCSASNAASYRPVFREIARSFRSLTRAERDGIQEARLRIVPARDGETLAAFAARTGSTWTPEELAVANALETGMRLRGGQPVKVPVLERYTPQPPR
ncbi:MAG: M48 family metalloprotease, partial [Deltaproteobacteria bacterium]